VTKSSTFDSADHPGVFVAVEAVQGHRDLFVDMSPGPLTPSTNLRVNGGTPRRLSSESSHSDASCHMDFSAISTFGTVASLVFFFIFVVVTHHCYHCLNCNGL